MAALATIPLLSVEEYLNFIPRPDVDYVDGLIEERNLGETDHADLQSELVTIFRNRRNQWRVRAFTELRVQVTPTRFRVPDVCILPVTWTRTQIVRQPPLLCLEVKSPKDTLTKLRERSHDFLRMGVPEVWIFDPASRTAYILRGDQMTEHHTGSLRLGGTPIELNLSEVFAVLDV